jgi:hypothetical protein
MSSPGPAVITGIDVDALATAVRSCHGVEDLDPGPLGSVVATYLPGRRVAGVRIATDRVTLQVKGTWGVPIRELATRIQDAVASLVGDRVVDVIVADLSEPAPPGGPHITSSPEPTTSTAGAVLPSSS